MEREREGEREREQLHGYGNRGGPILRPGPP